MNLITVEAQSNPGAFQITKILPKQRIRKKTVFNFENQRNKKMILT